MNPVLKYRGGKAREIPRLLPHIPKDFPRYLEPFFGGGAMYFYLEPERAVLNDINSRLMKFYRELRDRYPELRRQLDWLQTEYEANQADFARAKKMHPDELVPNANEELYYRLRNLYNYPDGSLLDSTLYFFMNKTAYSGMIRYNSAGEYNVPFGRYANLNTRLVTQGHSDLLKNAVLLNQDYGKVFAIAQKDDFMFLDPPYDCEFTDYGNQEMKNGFDEQQHRRLADDFRRLPCRALMVIGKTPLTEALYRQYIADEYYKNYSVNIRNRFKHDQIHLIVRNY